MSYHIISCHVMSYHIVSYIISYRIISYIVLYLISYHIVSYHMSSHIIIPYHIMSYIISYHISYHISYRILYHIISYHISYRNLRHNWWKRQKILLIGGFNVLYCCLDTLSHKLRNLYVHTLSHKLRNLYVHTLANPGGRAISGVGLRPLFLRLRVQISPTAWTSVSCECWVLSRRSLCAGLITGVLWCVQTVWSRKPVRKEPWTPNEV